MFSYHLIWLITQTWPDKHKGFAFVVYEEEEDAIAAMENMDGAELLGKTIYCNFSKPQMKMQYGMLSAVREMPLFEPFVYKNDHFTKTGSGQTQGKLKQEGGLCRALEHFGNADWWENGTFCAIYI